MKVAEIKYLLLICLLALGLRLAGLNFDSLWLDEAYQTMSDTYGQSLPDFTNPNAPAFLFRFEKPQPVGQLLANFRKVDPLCPPLYPVLLNSWIGLVGAPATFFGDFPIRLLSVLFSLASILASYFFCRQFLGLRVAVLASLFQAVSPFDIYYAQEARMYSLMVLSACLSAGSFWAIIAKFTQIQRIVGKSTVTELAFYWLLYVLSSWALINTHYTGLFLISFQMIYGLSIIAIRRDWKLLLVFVAAGISVLLLWLPWLNMFFQASAARKQSFYVARQFSLAWPFWALFIRIPLNWLAFLAGKKVFGFACPLYVTSAVSLVLAFLAAFKLRILPKKVFSHMQAAEKSDGKSLLGKNQFRATTFLWLWAAVPALVLWLIDVVEGHRVIEMARYVIYTAPAIYMIAGYGIASLLSYSRLVPCFLALHCFFALVNNAWSHQVFQREPWKQMAQAVEANCQADDVIFVSQYYDIVCLDRYLTKPFVQIGISPAMGKAHIASLVSKYKRFFLLTAQEGEEASQMVPPTFREVESKTVHLKHGLSLRLYQASP